MKLMFFGFLFCGQFAYSENENSLKCSDYRVGESRTFSKSSSSDGMHSEVQYAVKRSANNAYTVFVDVDFDGNEHMKNRVSRCLNEMNRIGLAPSGPVNIFLKLYDLDSGIREKPEKVSISVDENTERSNAESWSEDMTCKEMIHELLHIAGLSDEYFEKSITIKKFMFLKMYSSDHSEAPLRPSFDCRSRSDSIMGEIEFLSVTEKKYQESGMPMMCAVPVELEPNEGVRLYNEFLEKSYQNPISHCPNGLENIDISEGPSRPKYSEGKNEDSYSRAFILYPYMRYLSPLRKAHVIKLLWPNCIAKNWLYETCIANAYKTSEGRNGDGCLNTPSICHEFNLWLDK